MSQIIILQIDKVTGQTRYGTTYVDMPTAMIAAEAAADAYIATNGGTKITNTTSNRVYVKLTQIDSHETDLNLGDTPGDGLTISSSKDIMASKWYCIA